MPAPQPHRAAFSAQRLDKEPRHDSTDQSLERIPMVSGGSAERAPILLLHPHNYLILNYIHRGVLLQT